MFFPVRGFEQTTDAGGISASRWMEASEIFG
jgi:hypothetical protein